MRKSIILVFIIVVLPGCGRLIDWGKSRFYQGNSVQFNRESATDYIRWATIYDQFTPILMVDALLLSDPVRTWYAREVSFRDGKSSEHYKVFLRRQLEENNHYLSFYVLVGPAEQSLGDLLSEWKVLLSVDGTMVYPTECKVVDIPHEYTFIFDKKMSTFKNNYCIQFSALQSDGTHIIKEGTQCIKLHFRRVDREVILTWQFDDHGQLIKQKTSGGEPLFGYKKQINDTLYED